MISPLIMMGIMTGMLTACASTAVIPPDIPQLDHFPEQHVSRVDILQVTPEMKAFVRQHAQSERRNDGNAWSLAYAVLDPYLFAFDYDPNTTLPAGKAFELRQGNCLTFSALFIAMAREAGMDAWYQEVKILPEWNSVNDTLLVGKHVNAVVQNYGRTYTVDVSRRKREALEETRRLSDEQAEAQYYNNLGVDALIDFELSVAYAYFRKALDTYPDEAYVWSNLAVVLRRNGQTDDAIFAYETALQIDPELNVALNNLYTIYEEDEKFAEAEQLHRRVERNRRKNPYYLHYLAETANEEQRYSDAITLLKRAIRIKEDEYRFHYTLAQSQYFAGKSGIAETSLDRARQLAPPNLRTGPLTLPDERLD